MPPPPLPSDPPRRRGTLPGGRAFAFTDEGEGPVVLAVHGIPGSARDFRWLAPALPGVRLVRLDLPGFGETPLASGPGASLVERGAFVAAAAQALGLERYALLGHSMGGGVAIAAAAQRPEPVTALALVSSIGLRPHRAFRRVRAPGAVATALGLPLVGGPLRALVRRAFVTMGFSPLVTGAEVAHTLRCIAGTRFEDQAAHVKRLRAPTLLAWADDDAFIEPEVFEALAAALPEGPRLRWPTGGHNPQKGHALELGAAVRRLVGA